MHKNCYKIVKIYKIEIDKWDNLIIWDANWV